MIPLLLAGASGILSAVSQSQARRDARDEAEQLKKNYLSAMYTPDEEARKLDRVSDLWNTQTGEALNQYATSSRGVLNADTMRALTISKLAAQKSQAMTETANQVSAYNHDLLAKAASVNVPSDAFDPMSLISPMISGYMLGDQIERSNRLEELIGKKKELSNG